MATEHGLRKGIWYGIGAYGAWGLFPIYWKWLKTVPAPVVLGHRIVWSFLCLAAVLLITRRWDEWKSTLDRQTIVLYAVAALLIGVNWLTYVWAVNAGFIVETSLGYYINPLISVILGVGFFRERPRPLQWVSVGIAATGVGYLTFIHGQLPWIALTLAFSFAFYGLIKKVAPLNALHGLTLETALLLIPAAAFLVVAGTRGGQVFGPTWLTATLLAGGGVVTTIPLLMFAAAARRIPLSLVGMLQYIAPTLQLVVGLMIFGEELAGTRLIGFGIVWVALVLFALENLLVRRESVVPVVAEAE
jgi:chloramphenicol-sensitive protein RarD